MYPMTITIFTTSRIRGLTLRGASWREVGEGGERERISQSGVDGCALTFDRCQFYTPVAPNERGARVFLPLIRGEPSPPLPYPTLARSQPIICFVIPSRIQRSNMEGPGCISLPVGVDPQIKDSSDDQSAAESSRYISCLGRKSANAQRRCSPG